MPRAEVFIPEDRQGWWGGPDKRLRCRADGKVVFVDREAAQRSVDKAGTPMKCYLGRCGHWHTARRKK